MLSICWVLSFGINKTGLLAVSRELSNCTTVSSFDCLIFLSIGISLILILEATSFITSR